MRAERTLIIFILIEALPYIECEVSFTQPTVISSSYEDVYVREGSDAKLVWTYSITTDRNELALTNAVTWSTFIPQLTSDGANRKGLIVEKRNGTRENLGTIPSYLTGRISIEDQATLVISSVKTTDDNFYACQLSTTSLATPVVSSLIRLTVRKPPVITTPLINSSYDEGTKIDVICNVTGKPTPTVIWFREGSSKVYSTGEGSASLSFSSVSRSDAGQYRCKANNTAGTDETGVLPLVVHYKPEQTTFSTNATGSNAVAGEYILLKCEVPAGAAKPAVSQYKFYHGSTSSKPLQSSPSGEYVIPNIQYKDRGSYICVASNSAGDGHEQFLAISVKVPASITSPSSSVRSVAEGERVPLVCVVTGHPSPRATWTKGGRTVGVNGDATIVKSTRGDAGDYTCTANNDVGESKTITVTVEILYKPEIVTGESNKTVGSWDNNDLTLQCVARGVPTASFRWFKPGGGEITTNVNPFKGGSRVTVTTRAPGDYGQYKCRANNSLGVTDHIIIVNQWRKPGKPKINFTDVQASYIRVKWTPPVDDGGSPVIDYRVIVDGASGKNRPPVTGTETLIEQLMPGKSYSVILSARNVVGYGESETFPFTTRTKGKPGIPMLQNSETAVTSEKIKLTWSAAAENGGKILTYTVWWREVASNGGVGDWRTQNTSSDGLTYTLTGLKFGNTYDFGITAWNKYGESALDEANNLKRIKVTPKPTFKPTNPPEEIKGVNAAAIGGGAAAAIVIILVVVIVIVLLKRRKASPGKGESRDPLGGGSGDEGYASVSKASAARRLGQNNQGNEEAAIPTYATVDLSKKVPKKPDLIYAELADFDNDGARAASMKRPAHRYEPTDYAEITQFGRPAEPTYDNVPRY